MKKLKFEHPSSFICQPIDIAMVVYQRQMALLSNSNSHTGTGNLNEIAGRNRRSRQSGASLA